MSLVDKLGEVHRGDFIYMFGGNGDVAGVIRDYSATHVTLSTRSIQEHHQTMSFFARKAHRLFWADRGTKYNLKYFDKHQIFKPKKVEKKVEKKEEPKS